MINLKKISHRVYLYLVIGLLIFVGLFLPYYFGYYKTKGERWIKTYLREIAGIETKWGDLNINLRSSQIVISNLDMVHKQYPQNYLIAPRLTISYSPMRLLHKKLFLKDIRVEGLFLTINNSQDIINLALENTNKKSSWKIIWQNMKIISGKKINIKIPEKELLIDAHGINLVINRLNNKRKQYPFSLSLEGGKINWRDINRTIKIGKIKGVLEPLKLSILESKIRIFEDQGFINWAGDISFKDALFLKGNYQASLKAKTLAHFWKCFNQMNGQIDSNGELDISKKNKIAIGTLKSNSFKWRSLHFTDVRGKYSYQNNSKSLAFEDMTGYFNKAKIEAFAKLDFLNNKATVEIFGDEIHPSYFDISFKYPIRLKDSFWKGHLFWELNWPNYILKTEGEIILDEIMPKYEKRNPLAIKANFNQEKDIINFMPLRVSYGRDNLEANGIYIFNKNMLNFSLDASLFDISSIWSGKISGKTNILGQLKGTLAQYQIVGIANSKNLKWYTYHVDNILLKYDFQNNKGLDLKEIVINKDDIKAKGGGYLKFAKSADMIPKEISEGLISWESNNIPINQIFKKENILKKFYIMGHLDGKGSVKIGKNRDIKVLGHMLSKDLSFLGQPIMNLDTNFILDTNSIQMDKIIIKNDRGNNIRAQVYHTFNGMTYIDANSTNFKVSPISLFSHDVIPISSIVSFNLNGNLENFKGSLKTEELFWRNNKLLNTQTEFTINNKNLTANLFHKFGEMDAWVDLSKDYAFKIQGDVEKFAISDYIPKEMINEKTQISISGTGVAKGSLKKWRESEAKFSIDKLSLKTKIGAFTNQRPSLLSYLGGELMLSSLLLEGEDTNLNINGKWSQDIGVDAQVTGLVQLEFFEKYLSELDNLKGHALINISLGGSIDIPQINGSVVLSKGSFQLPFLNSRMEDIGGSLKFNNNIIIINNLNGKLRNGGFLSLNGKFNYNPVDFAQISCSLQDLFFFKSNRFKFYLGGDLNWNLTPKGSELEGKLTIDEGRYYTHKDLLALLLTKHRDVSVESNIWGTEKLKSKLHNFFNNMILKVDLDIGQNFNVLTPYLEARLTGKFNIKDSAIDPIIVGQIKALDADIFIGGHKFSVVSGQILLPEPTQGQPIVNALAFKDINEYRLRLSILGPIDKPKFLFSSSPYLSQREIVNMLFSGFALGSGASKYRNRSDIISKMFSTTNLIIDNVLGEDIEAQYDGYDNLRWNILSQNLFRLDIFNLKLQEEGGMVEKLTLGKQLSSNFTIKYSENIGGDEEYRITEAEYNITDHFTVIGSQNDEGVYTFDLNFGLDF